MKYFNYILNCTMLILLLVTFSFATSTPTSTLFVGGGLEFKDGIGTNATFHLPSGITSDGTFVYVADTLNNRIRRIEISTKEVTTIGGNGTSGFAEGIGNASNFNHPKDVMLSGDGLLYIADNGNNGAIRRINLTTNQSDTFYSSFVDFHDTTSLAEDFNYIYFADRNHHVIRRINRTYPVTSEIIVGTLDANGSQDGIGSNARLNYPYGLAFGNDGFLYFSDTSNHVIRKINITTNETFFVAGNISLSGNVSQNITHLNAQDGTGTNSSFYYPAHIKNFNGFIYVADQGTNRIRKIDYSIPGVVVSTVTDYGYIGRKGMEYSSNPNMGLTKPLSVAFDSNHMYVTDTYNNIIVMDDEPLGGNYQNYKEGIGESALISARIGGMVNPGDGFIYFTDTYNNRIRKINITSKETFLVAGNGFYGHQDGTGTNAMFMFPMDLDYKNGYLYVAGFFDYTIRKINVLTGETSTIVGDHTFANYTEGIGTGAKFYDPAGLNFCDDGFLYVSDGNSVIRKINVTTAETFFVAGDNSSRNVENFLDFQGTGFVDGVGHESRFYWPVKLDCVNNTLYVADEINRAIRVINTTNRNVTTLTTVNSPFWAGLQYKVNDSSIYVDDTLRNVLIHINATNGSVIDTLGGINYEPEYPTYVEGTGDSIKFAWPGANINENDGSMYVNDRLNYRIRKIIFSSQGPIIFYYDNFKYFGNTTNLNNFSSDILVNVTNLTLSNPAGRIKWRSNQNVSDMNFDSNVILNLSFVSINSSGLKQSYNSTADIYLEGTDCAKFSREKLLYAPQHYSSKSEMIQNAITCPLDKCTNVVCIGSTLIFTVNSFSGYAVEGNTELNITNNGPKNSGELVTFNATYYGDGFPLDGAICNITTIEHTAIGPITGLGNGLYQVNLSFTYGYTDSTYSITCGTNGYPTLTAFDNVTIFGPSPPIQENAVPELSDYAIMIVIGCLIGITVYRKKI